MIVKSRRKKRNVDHVIMGQWLPRYVTLVHFAPRPYSLGMRDLQFWRVAGHLILERRFLFMPEQCFLPDVLTKPLSLNP